MKKVFTIGHSNHEPEIFLELLKKFSITALADVRSTPYSKYNNQFNRELLKSKLIENGIKYVFLGKELGARSSDLNCYDNNQVQYGLLAKTELFQQGIERIRQGSQKYRVCLMCSEKDPIDCHRMILVTKELVHKEFEIFHILSDGEIEPEKESVKRLRQRLKLDNPELFASENELEQLAYQRQEKIIAYITN